MMGKYNVHVILSLEVYEMQLSDYVIVHSREESVSTICVKDGKRKEQVNEIFEDLRSSDPDDRAIL